MTRLLAADLPCLLGHADWETQNLRWHGSDRVSPRRGQPGLAARGGDRRRSTRRTNANAARRVDANNIEVAWPASLWPAAHNDRGQVLFERPPVAEAALRDQADQRLQLAHA